MVMSILFGLAVVIVFALLQTVKPSLFERGIIIVVEVVDPEYRVAAIEQRARCCSTDESRSSRDQNSHEHPLGGAAAC